VVDGDKAGESERKRYAEEFGIPAQRLVTLKELSVNLKTIEDILDHTALDFIKKELKLSARPSKGQIRRFFQERLASDKIDHLGSAFVSTATNLLDGIEARLK